MLLRFKAPAIRMTKLQLFDLQVSSLFSRLHLLDTICSARRNLKLHGHEECQGTCAAGAVTGRVALRPLDCFEQVEIVTFCFINSCKWCLRSVSCGKRRSTHVSTCAVFRISGVAAKDVSSGF